MVSYLSSWTQNFHTKSRWRESRRCVRKGIEMWQFGRWKVGVNIWMCRCLCWVRLRGVCSEQPIWCCVLDLWPRQHWWKEPLFFSLRWTALPSLQDFCFSWTPSRNRVGVWRWGHSQDSSSTVTKDIPKRTTSCWAVKAGLQGGEEEFIPNHQVLRSWVGIGLPVPSGGVFIYFLFSYQLLHCLYISTIKFFLLLYFWLATWCCWEGMSKWLCRNWPVSQGQSSPLSHLLLNASQILSPHEFQTLTPIHGTALCQLRKVHKSNGSLIINNCCCWCTM